MLNAANSSLIGRSSLLLLFTHAVAWGLCSLVYLTASSLHFYFWHNHPCEPDMSDILKNVCAPLWTGLGWSCHSCPTIMTGPVHCHHRSRGYCNGKFTIPMTAKQYIIPSTRPHSFTSHQTPSLLYPHTFTSHPTPSLLHLTPNTPSLLHLTPNTPSLLHLTPNTLTLSPHTKHTLTPSPHTKHTLTPLPHTKHTLTPSPHTKHTLTPSPHTKHTLTPSPHTKHTLTPSPSHQTHPHSFTSHPTHPHSFTLTPNTPGEDGSRVGGMLQS